MPRNKNLGASGDPHQDDRPMRGPAFLRGHVTNQVAQQRPRKQRDFLAPTFTGNPVASGENLIADDLAGDDWEQRNLPDQQPEKRLLSEDDDPGYFAEDDYLLEQHEDTPMLEDGDVDLAANIEDDDEANSDVLDEGRHFSRLDTRSTNHINRAYPSNCPRGRAAGRRVRRTCGHSFGPAIR